MSVQRVIGGVSILALLALVAGIVRERPAPGFHELPAGLPGGTPATLYYQESPGAPAATRPGLERPAPGELHAGVVVAHGFAGDRHTMRAISQSLARAGYLVLSLDLSGHGVNRNPLWGDTDPLVRDLRTGVEYLQQKFGIDPSKIVVLGHSMGARAAFDYGLREGAAGGLVMMSGSADVAGPARPRNALLLYAEHDLPGIGRMARAAAASLAHADPLEERTTYGDFAAGTAVRVVQIRGVAHGTILASPIAFAEVVGWIDQVTGFPARTSAPTLPRHPLGSPLLWFSFFLVLPGLGLLLGHLSPEPPLGAAQARLRELALLAVALLLPLPFLAVGRSGLLFRLNLADGNVTHLALAGLLLLVALILRGRFRTAIAGLPASFAVAALGGLAAAVLLAPASAWFHGVSLTPERALLALWSAACLAPFALTAQWLVARPQWWRGALLRLVARFAVLASVVVGNVLGVFGFPGTIAIFALIASLTIVEPMLAGFYLRSRNSVTAGCLDAVVTAWLFTVNLPTSA